MIQTRVNRGFFILSKKNLVTFDVKNLYRLPNEAKNVF